jgi:uncharacterized protein (AIM24 family)
MDFESLGLQIVRVRLDAGDKLWSDPGELMAKSANIRTSPKAEGGVFDSFKRKLSGGKFFPIEFSVAQGQEAGYVTLSGNPPGIVKVLNLGENESFFVEHFSFIAAQSSLKFSTDVIGLKAVTFGVSSTMLLEKFTGPGYLFMRGVGGVAEQDLDGSEPFDVEEGHILGFDSGLTYDIKFVDPSTAVFADIGLTLARFTGKGRVMMHAISKTKYLAQQYSVPSK